MRLIYLGSLAVLLVSGCAARFSGLPADVPTNTVTLRWQRLVDASDKTCPRCTSTEQEVAKAFAHLKRSLAPAGIAVALETDRLDEAAFAAAPLESNKIWINGRLMEDWLGAQSASSPCSGCCGSKPCRTVEMCGQTYEAIPAALIVRAGFLAAADELRGGSAPPDSASGQPSSGAQ
jgi:hypothetical protein